MKVPIKPGTIFVSIAAYRDPVCNSTLKSMYSMAKNPKNIYCGVIQQNDESQDADCLLESTDSIVTENVIMMRIKHYEGKGPTWARYLAANLWSGQEYFLQIDSHTRFVKNWDAKCIEMMKRLDAKGINKAVLSHYARDIKDYEKIDDFDPKIVTRLCQTYFMKVRDGILKYTGADEIHTNDEFYETPYVSGNFLFAKHQLLKDVPFDPNLDFLFVGEEMGHSVRIWTSGYNIYTPTENVVFHEYGREGKPKVWTDNKYTDIDSVEKIKQIIGQKSSHQLPENIKYNIEKYGLGKERTIEAYHEFAGIDLKNKIVTKNFCRKNNVATPDDIFLSNELLHKTPEEAKKEGFVSSRENSFFNKKNVIFIFIIFFFLLVALFLMKFSKNKITFFHSIKKLKWKGFFAN